MNKLTPIGRIFIVLLVVGAGFGIFKLLQSQGIIGKGETARTETTSDTVSRPDADNTRTTPDNTGTDQNRPAFSYTPPEPVNGKLKGVVELGASGFNSFIIRIDGQKNWKLEKAEFGHSLAIENMASENDIRAGLKDYISGMLNMGVGGKDIHFVVSSGAVKAENTLKIMKVLKSMGYFVNTVTPQQEGTLALNCVLPASYEASAFVADIGSGNTKISWKEAGQVKAVESYGAKYFQNGTDDKKVYDEVKAKASQIAEANRKTCFIIGGVPFKLAKEIRPGKERYTLLKAPAAYALTDAKDKAGVNIYKALADATGCEQFVFDWDANFTIGFLLGLP